METGALEDAYETEKETEFQQVTKAIKKRNWRKIFQRTVACTLVFTILLFAAGTIYVRYDHVGPYDVITGDIVYWNEDEQRENKNVFFQYEGQDYTYLNPYEDIGRQLFDEKVKSYFRFGPNWEELLEDKSKAAFNVQSEWASPWADLMLDNNRATMYAVAPIAEENMYMDTRDFYLYIPPTSKEKVLDYYNDVDNYTWSLSEFIDVPMTDPNPAKNHKEREGVDIGFSSEDVKNMITALSAGETISVMEDYSKLHYVHLDMTSKDGVIGCHLSVENLEGKWYALGEMYHETNGDVYNKMLELPKSIGEKIDAALAE